MDLDLQNHETQMTNSGTELIFQGRTNCYTALRWFTLLLLGLRVIRYTVCKVFIKHHGMSTWIAGTILAMQKFWWGGVLCAACTSLYLLCWSNHCVKSAIQRSIRNMDKGDILHWHETGSRPQQSMGGWCMRVVLYIFDCALIYIPNATTLPVTV